MDGPIKRVVALGAALPIPLPAAHHVIRAAQRAGTPGPAGGPGFGVDGRHARRLGVDAWAPTAPDAVALHDALDDELADAEPTPFPFARSCLDAARAVCI